MTSVAPTDNNLFGLLGMRMDYLKQRQAVIAKNVANADLPDYKAKDLVPFASALDARGGNGNTHGVKGTHVLPVSLITTNAGHLNGSGNPTGTNFSSNKPAESYETLPSGNSVVLEEQMMKISEVGTDYALVTNLYREAQGMMKMALGKANG